MNNGPLLIKIVVIFPFINISFHWSNSEQNIWKSLSVNNEEITELGICIYDLGQIMIYKFNSIYFCFTDFDCLRNKGFSNAIPPGTFTNISNKNMKGSRTYDHIWLTKDTKNITSGNDQILPNFKIYFFNFHGLKLLKQI